MNQEPSFYQTTLSFLIGNAPFAQSGYIRKYACLLGDRVGCKRIGCVYRDVVRQLKRQDPDNGNTTLI
jgi:hypothetical protein